MFEQNRFKTAALAAAIALAMATTSVMAAAPAANALPGQGKVALGTIDAATTGVSTDGKTLTVTLTAGPAVINWGSGTDINKTGTAGFNIGSAETVTFAGTYPVLNIDSSGNASQIFGALGAADNVYVANANGIIVGAGGSITSPGEIGLLGNTTIGTNAGFTGTAASLTYQGGGGDVSVQSGASLDGGTVLISGGGNVNVDLGALTAGATTLSAGLSSATVFPATPNTRANVAITGGTLAGGSIATINSAGTASNAATLDLSGATTTAVKGAFTNTGELTLGAANGTIVNQGKLTTAGAATFDSLTNAGAYGANTSITINSGGSLTNTGSITGAGSVVVNDGSINNSGSIAGVTSLTTQSDSGAAGFTAGGQDYINNTGSITATAGLTINANITRVGTDNDSTGSFTNTGTLNLGANGTLGILANNNVSLGGTLKAGATPAALSATNSLAVVNLDAGGGGTPFAANGALSVLTPIFATGAILRGPQVKLMSDVTTTLGDVDIAAGAASATDYAVRVANGVTVTAAAGAAILVNGDKASDNPNVILQGTLSADFIEFGVGGNSVSDVFSGPNGGLVATGATPVVVFDFTGTIKTAKYNNDANFRYNYLPIDASKATGPVALTLNPTAYTTNGTSNGLSAVNILVDGNVILDGGAPYAPGLSGVGTAVTGVVTTPNTHLVLQSIGNIAAVPNFYWPGYVYLGTIDTNTDGSAAPGTLSADGTITLLGNFTNELPGDVAGASGIHFMSGNALVGTGQVTTNANAWVNFPTDLLTQGYAQGVITGGPSFFGGVATGLIVNYGKLDASSFNTHPVDATR